MGSELNVQAGATGHEQSSPCNLAKKPDLVNISGVELESEWVPSRFNARSIAPNGTLLLYNSYTGAFSGFPPEVRPAVESLLKRSGVKAKKEHLVKYLAARGFLVPHGTNEMQRFRLQYGVYQNATDVLELILLASEECNFRCVYCYETFPRDTMEKWVREAILKLVEQRISRLRQLRIAWFGGEPLLGLEAIREIAPACLKMAAAAGVDYSSSITTNGYLLTPDVFADLLSWRTTTYQITIDGTPKDHDKKRVLANGGGPSFSVIYSNLKAMRAFKEAFRVYLRVNFDHDNLAGMDEFMGLLKEDFAGDPRFELHFSPIGKWGGPNDESLNVCGTGRYDVKQELDARATDMGLKPGSRLAAMTPHSVVNVCYAARPYSLLIGADGKIMKCTIVLDQKDYNIVGQLTRDGRAELDVDKFARWVTPYFEDDAECRKCFYLPVCQGCSCPLVRIEENQRPCPSDKLNIKKALNAEWRLREGTRFKYDVGKGKVVR